MELRDLGWFKIDEALIAQMQEIPGYYYGRQRAPLGPADRRFRPYDIGLGGISMYPLFGAPREYALCYQNDTVALRVGESLLVNMPETSKKWFAEVEGANLIPLTEVLGTSLETYRPAQQEKLLQSWGQSGYRYHSLNDPQPFQGVEEAHIPSSVELLDYCPRRFAVKFTANLEETLWENTYVVILYHRRGSWGFRIYGAKQWGSCVHPHIEQGGSVCFGTAEDPIYNYLRRGKWLQAIYLMINFLQTWNPFDCYLGFSEWSKWIVREYDRRKEAGEAINAEAEELVTNLKAITPTDARHPNHEGYMSIQRIMREHYLPWDKAHARWLANEAEQERSEEADRAYRAQRQRQLEERTRGESSGGTDDSSTGGFTISWSRSRSGSEGATPTAPTSGPATEDLSEVTPDPPTEDLPSE